MQAQTMTAYPMRHVSLPGGSNVAANPNALNNATAIRTDAIATLASMGMPSSSLFVVANFSRSQSLETGWIIFNTGKLNGYAFVASQPMLRKFFVRLSEQRLSIPAAGA